MFVHHCNRCCVNFKEIQPCSPKYRGIWAICMHKMMFPFQSVHSANSVRFPLSRKIIGPTFSQCTLQVSVLLTSASLRSSGNHRMTTLHAAPSDFLSASASVLEWTQVTIPHYASSTS